MVYPRFSPLFLVGIRWLALGASVLGAASAAEAQTAAKRVYHAVRLTGAAPTIDGKLTEACWQDGEWADGYRQREPETGAVPTAPTDLKILYDNRNLYVAIRAHDPEMATQPRLLGNRDQFTGDMVGVAFDSFMNQRSAFEFDVTSGGSKLDLVLHNDGSIDTNWNAVWDVKVAADATGWTAEYRIPLSQLRYAGRREQVWGLHAWRWIRRRSEESNWQVIPMGTQDFVRSFGELRGIADLPPSRRIEILPYVVAKTQRSADEPGNPFRHGARNDFNGGLDAKVGLSSDMTLDVTVNPDFGQVEADPSEINLSTVETFFSEKRPFFVEGKSMFELGLDDDLLFYSRRIGAAPSLSPDGATFTDFPENTRILAAAKVSGRTAHGLSVGVLQSATDRMETRIYDPATGERRELAEPLTHYTVARVQQDLDDGNTIIGGMCTAVQRVAGEAELGPLVKRALAGAIDVQRYWGGRTYFLDVRTLVTRIEGSQAALQAVQTDSVHNFQREDDDRRQLDATARSLSGDAGRVRIGKSANGDWRYFAGVNWRSPGVEFNDLGYLRVADVLEPVAQLEYFNSDAGRLLRRRDVQLRLRQTRDFDGERLENVGVVQTELGGMSGWSLWSQVTARTQRLDTHMLRGGPGFRLANVYGADVFAETDGAKATRFELDGGYSHAPESGYRYYRIRPGVTHRFGDRLVLDAEIGYERGDPHQQYVASPVSSGGATRYVIGRMRQETLAAEFKAQVNFSPTLSLTYYGGPFVSVGRFSDFGVVTSPRAARLEDRYAKFLATRTAAGGYEATWAGETLAFDDPDFHWRELKSNLVLKWEFRPGSTLYAVWSQHREDTRDTGGFDGLPEYGRLMSAHPDNTLLVKMSYWFSI